jgi:hypothetical protein
MISTPNMFSFLYCGYLTQMEFDMLGSGVHYVQYVQCSILKMFHLQY